MTSGNGDPNGNIWISAKCHKEAEARYRRYDLLAVLLQVWLAGWMMYISVIFSKNGIEAHQVDPTNLNAIISGLLIAVSVLFWAFRLGERAAAHRDCYNTLDRLLAEKKPNIQEEYRSKLAYYPNFAGTDHRKVLFDAWMMGNELRNRSRVVSLTFSVGILYVIESIVRAIVAALLFGVPIILIYFVEMY